MAYRHEKNRSKRMRNIVVLDYGHGWDTPGKRSPDGELMEGRWSRDVGPRIAKALREVGLDVVEIINSKDDIPLKERCARVNDVVRKNPHDNILYSFLAHISPSY